MIDPAPCRGQGEVFLGPHLRGSAQEASVTSEAPIQAPSAWPLVVDLSQLLWKTSQEEGRPKPSGEEYRAQHGGFSLAFCRFPLIWPPGAPDILHLQVQVGTEFLVEMVQ